MISKAERRKIKKVLGGHYTAAILEELHRLGVRNKYGLPHSATMIQTVMNGQPHREIERAILNAYEQKLAEIKAENERKEKLFNNKTGVAAPV